MPDMIYRLDLWRFSNFKIDTLEVVKKTDKTVVVRIYHEVGEGFRRACSDSRYSLKSGNYTFFDTLESAELAATNVIVNRLAQYNDRVEELQRRLQEVCKHKEITGPFLGEKCVRCDFQVPNPEDYSNGGG